MRRFYAYLRASTDDQDADRARTDLEAFADQYGFRISAWFLENESGARLDRPELFRLLDIAEPGDVLLVEQVDRLSRLNTEDWRQLRRLIADKQIHVVALDLPTSHQLIRSGDEFTDRILTALNDLMLDMLAAVARKDYEDRRRRQRQGIDKAKSLGRYRGRPKDEKLRAKIARLLSEGKSWAEVVDLLGCSKATISSVAKDMKSSV